MTPTPTQALEPVEVTQADRDAAQAYLDDPKHNISRFTTRRILDEAFARHRQSSNAASELARLAKNFLAAHDLSAADPASAELESRELDAISDLRYALAALTPSALSGDAGEGENPMTDEERRLVDLEQMASYGGPIVSFDVRAPYYLASGLITLADHEAAHSSLKERLATAETDRDDWEAKFKQAVCDLEKADVEIEAYKEGAKALHRGIDDGVAEIVRLTRGWDKADKSVQLLRRQLDESEAELADMKAHFNQRLADAVQDYEADALAMRRKRQMDRDRVRPSRSKSPARAAGKREVK